MNERTMVYLDDVIEVIYQALRTPVPDYHKDPFHDSMGVAMAMANEIPSAQSETFEWCHDCKEYDQEKHCCPRWTKRIRRTVEELEARYPQDKKVELDYWKQRAKYAERKRGKWIRITQGAIPEKYMCPFCHRTVEHEGVEYFVSIIYPFCHCGADMRDENNE